MHLKGGKRMKKNLLIFMAVLSAMAMVLCGCGNTNTKRAEKSTEEQYADEDFMKDLAAGLEARWSVEEPEQYTEGDDASKEYYTEMVNAEYEKVTPYLDKKFKDSTLQQKAINYINMIKQQKEALKYMQVNYDKYSELWGEAYDERSKLIVDFMENYGLTVSDKYKSTLDDFKTNAQEVEDKEIKDSEVNAILSNMNFKKDKNSSYDWKEYDAVVKNTSSIDFDSFMVNVNLLDKEGVIVESTTVYVNNWKKGTKTKFTFSTDKEFDKISIEQADWSEMQE